MNNSFLIFLYTHAESSISLRIYLRRDVFWPYRTRGKATPSVSSVPKCSGASKVPTDTHGAAEISPISSIRTVIEFFFPLQEFIIQRPCFRSNSFFILFWALTEVRPNDPTPPSEENVTFLTSMGFSRDRVMRALQTTGNNVEAAANLLVNDV